MTDDRTDQLIRDAFADEAARAVDSREVLANVRGRRPRRSHGLVLAAAAVVVVVAAVATFVVPKAFREATPPATQQHQTTQPVTPTSVLVVGTDENGNTDSLILARLTATNTDLISLPRDSWVSSGGQMTRLNQIYMASGIDALRTAVGDLTGVPVEHYAVVDMAGVGDMTTAVGGVEVCLRAATKDKFSGADFPAGKQVITGDAALAFIRQRRGLPNGDLDRIARLQAFVRGLAIALDGKHDSKLLPVIQQHVKTDPSLDVIGLTQRLVGAKELRFATIPIGDLDFQPPNGGSVIQVDPNEVRQFVAGMQGTPPTPAAGDVPCVN
jgi:LCP family protein required for cell wall assembly